MTTETCDCDFFDFGDSVRSRINPHLTGVIIGESDWGDRYHVRLADGATTIWWHSIEIEHDPDAMPPAASKRQDDETDGLAGNVVPFARKVVH